MKFLFRLLAVGVTAVCLCGCAVKRDPVVLVEPFFSYLQVEPIAAPLTATAMADADVRLQAVTQLASGE